jgi:hypothetical protein
LSLTEDSEYLETLLTLLIHFSIATIPSDHARILARRFETVAHPGFTLLQARRKTNPAIFSTRTLFL